MPVSAMKISCVTDSPARTKLVTGEAIPFAIIDGTNWSRKPMTRPGAAATASGIAIRFNRGTSGIVMKCRMGVW